MYNDVPLCTYTAVPVSCMFVRQIHSSTYALSPVCKYRCTGMCDISCVS